MSFLTAMGRGAICIGLGVSLAGCFPFSQNSLNEQKDPNFLTGKGRKMAMDYTGAAGAFEKALEANPRSASAHFELGLLYYENLSDWAAAIYHFEKYLRLQPRSNKADVIRQFVAACKQELVKGVPLGPVNEQVKRELEKLVMEKERLARENSQLQLQVEQLKGRLARRATPEANGFSASNTSLRALTQAQTPPSGTLQPAQQTAAPPASARESTRAAAAAKTHVVRAGDTPYAIARSYGVKLAELLSANPGLDPRRLRPGQALTIPSS
jgi:LysM repeat protein